MEIEDILEEDLLSMMNDFDMPSVTTKKVVQAINTPQKIDEITFDNYDLEDEKELEVELPPVAPKKQAVEKQTQNEKCLNLSDSNLGDLGKILKELLSNKTIEITIKIKDN